MARYTLLVSVVLAVGPAGAAAHAQGPTMFPSPRFPAGSGAYRMVVADFDSDGILDVVTCNWKSGTLTLLHGAGDATFYPPEVVGTAAGPRGLASGDVDADGDADLVVCNSEADSVTVLLGRGNGTFEAGATVLVGKLPEPAELGDLNGDGKLDLVVGIWDEGATRWLLGDGTGGFSLADSVPTGRWPKDIDLADLNADGRLDIAVANSFDTDVAVLLGTGHGQFSAPVFYDGTIGAHGIELADLSGDTVPDMVVALNGSDSGLQLRLGTGTGTFGPPVVLTGDATVDVAVADADGDGDPDLLASRYSYPESGLLLFANDGAAGFTLGAEVGVGPPPTGLVAADLDLDGSADLVAVSGEEDIIALRGFGDGSFDGPGAIDSYGAWGSLAVADFDLDGHQDLALGILSDPHSVQLRRGAGDGTFGPPLVALEAPLPRIIQAPDLDEDGIPDLVVGSNGAHELRLVRGHGDLTFTPVQSLEFELGIAALLVDDLSGDGALDIALGQSTHSIDVYVGNGDGTFSSMPHQVLDLTSVASLASGDIDGDGLIDLVVGHHASGFTPILGTGGGSFAIPAPSPAGGSSFRVALAPLDADGHLDLVVVHNLPLEPFGVSIHHGLGDGTFGSAQGILPGHIVRDVSILDLDLDGTLDVLAGLSTSEAIDKLLGVVAGAGDGTFEPPRLFGLAHDPDVLAPADFDEDGWTDVAISGDFFQTSIVLHRPPGVWSNVGQGATGSAGTPDLTGAGDFAAGAPVSLVVTSGPSLSPAWLVAGFSELGLPFKGGTMVPMPDVLVGPVTTNSVGVASLSGVPAAGLAPGSKLWFQVWIADAGAQHGFAATNALGATVP